jgi:hypothetical protein
MQATTIVMVFEFPLVVSLVKTIDVVGATMVGGVFDVKSAGERDGDSVGILVGVAVVDVGAEVGADVDVTVGAVVGAPDVGAEVG